MHVYIGKYTKVYRVKLPANSEKLFKKVGKKCSHMLSLNGLKRALVENSGNTILRSIKMAGLPTFAMPEIQGHP